MSRETVEWVPVSAPEQVREVAALAKEIWGEPYRGLLTPGQITYMVDRFQSEEAITLQLSEGYQYRLITVGDEPAGYAASRTEEGRLFLSKLYVRKRFRRRGLARRTVDGLNRLCREQGLVALYLTVNRENAGSIAAYLAMGFRKVREQVTDIGEGYSGKSRGTVKHPLLRRFGPMRGLL